MNVLCIAGLPCTGKTTLGRNLAIEYDALSFDLEVLRTEFFEQDLDENMFKYTKNEPILKTESYRDYFLRCVIYERKLNLKEYVKWYIVIMEYMNEKINEIIKSFNELEYNLFLKKYSKVINHKPLTRPKTLAFNHALLPLTDIWDKSSLSIILNAADDILINRYVKRENLKLTSELKKDLSRHLQMYQILNRNKSHDILIETTNNFADINYIKNVVKERKI